VTLKSEKAEARVRALDVRDGLHRQYGGDAGARLADHFIAALPPAAGIKVSVFWPMGAEIDTRPLLAALHKAGCLCLLPAVETRNAPLVFRAWQPGATLVASDFGVMEPQPSAAAHIPDIVAVPLLAFDGIGVRLGYGGGYYDRTLADLWSNNEKEILAVGLCYAGQRVDTLPEGPFDRRLDMVVTETGVIRFSNNRAGS